MRHASTLFATGLALSVTAFADVRELEGEEMVGTFVQGISIGQPVVGKEFDSDDEDLREATADQRNSLGAPKPELAVTNAEALVQEPVLGDLIADMKNQDARDLVEDSIMQTSLSTRVDFNVDRLAADTGTQPETDKQDFSVLRGSILELLPSATGYQFEFMKDRF